MDSAIATAITTAITFIIFGVGIFIDRWQQRQQDERNNSALLKSVKVQDEKNKIDSKRLYLDKICPRQIKLMKRIKDLRAIYSNYDKNLNIRWVVKIDIKPETVQPSLENYKGDGEFAYYQTVYSEFISLIPLVKNLFPKSYPRYWNFTRGLDEVLHNSIVRGSKEYKQIPIEKQVEAFRKNVDLLDKFIEDSYDSDGMLRNVWI